MSNYYQQTYAPFVCSTSIIFLFLVQLALLDMQIDIFRCGREGLENQHFQTPSMILSKLSSSATFLDKFKLLSSKPSPPLVIVHGGAGSGNSRVIKFLYTMMTEILCQPGDDPTALMLSSCPSKEHPWPILMVEPSFAYLAPPSCPCRKSSVPRKDFSSGISGVSLWTKSQWFLQILSTNWISD